MKSFFMRLAIVGAVLLSAPLLAHASTSDNMSGYAWSPYIGWISFNCTNDNSCGTVSYGVNKDVNGWITGYAWSPEVGWIQFGGLAGFPAGSGTLSQNAQVSGTSVVGWAKAITADGNGWDGWISLSGSTPNYGVTLSGLNFAGYAWGAADMDWISWNCSNDGSCGTSNYAVTLTGDATIDVQSGGTSIVNNNSVAYGTVPTYVWTLTNLSGASCTLWKTSSGGTAFSTITGITASGNTTGAALTNASYTFRFDCVQGGATTTSKTASFTVLAQPPGFSLGADDTAKIQLLTTGTADSQQKDVYVSAVGGFSNPVTISITTFMPAIASTTYSYSLNGGSTWSSNPSAIISSPYSTGAGFKVRVTRLAGAPAFTGPYTVTLTGTGAGVSNATKNIFVQPTSFNPTFQEF